nr:putative ribonuclease H-like domain-containing protein [Tanacetum cinerariifolium]
MQKVWILVDLPYGKRAIGTNWVYRNKKDERGIVIRNKARIIAQGHTQEEGIDYEEVFAPIARIEDIRLFLAYASFMGFPVYQMDVKSAFLYGTIKEEVYVCQPPGFEDPEYPDKVYKVVKALYRLHQAPRACYKTLATYLLENGFQRGTIDQTLFIKKQQKDILLVQIYVDDIIFGATNKALCQSFERLMKEKFQMSSMGELTFFLGLQVKQKKDGIFTSQDKYVAEILRKFILFEGKSASTLIDAEKSLLKDSDVKRIFRYLKGKPCLGLWYPKDSPFDLVAYSDSDYAGASLDRKSTTGGCQFLGCKLISWQCKKQIVVTTSSTKAKYVVAASGCAQVLWMQNQLLDYGILGYKLTMQFWNTAVVKRSSDVTRLQALVDKKRIVITEEVVHEILQLNDAEGGDDVHEHVAKDVDIDVVPPTPTLPSPSSPVIPSSPPRQSPSPPQPQAAEGLENANAAQQLEIVKLKARVKKLERINKWRISGDMETDEGIELVVDQEKDAEVEGRHADKQAEIYNIDLDHSSKVLSMQEDKEVQEAVEVVTAAKLITEVVTAAATQVVAASTPILAAKPKILKIATAPAVSTKRRKGVVIRDPEEELHTDTLAETPNVKDKGKGILIEDPKLMKKKDQVEMDAVERHMIKFFQSFKLGFMKFLFKIGEEIEKEDKEIIKSINETPTQKAAKRRKLSEEAQEVDDLRRHLEIVQDKDDDVFVEAIPLAQKVPVVDYQSNDDATRLKLKLFKMLLLLLTRKFLRGLHVFLEHCKTLLDPISGEIVCPCDLYGNSQTGSINTIWTHISENGFDSTHTIWDKHGESLPPPPPPPQPPSPEYDNMAAFLDEIIYPDNELHLDDFIELSGKDVACQDLRLQRLYKSQYTAKWMTWHNTGKSKENGQMNHPVDVQIMGEKSSSAVAGTSKVDGCTLLHLTCETIDVVMIELLLQYGVLSSRSQTPLHHCILKGKAASYKGLILKLQMTSEEQQAMFRIGTARLKVKRAWQFEMS